MTAEQILGIVASIAVILDFLIIHGPKILGMGAIVPQKYYNFSVNALLALALILATVSIYLSAAKQPIPLTEEQWRAYQKTQITGQHFQQERVVLDGKSFVKCDFDRVTLVINGTAPFDLLNNTFVAPILVTSDKPTILSTLRAAETLLRMTPQPQIESEVPVYDPFSKAYDEYHVQLGKPITKGQPVGEDAYQAKFQHATHIWSPLAFYVLHGDGHWEQVPEDSIPPDTKKWWDQKWLTEHFRPTLGFGPPEGSLAYLWDKDPKRWSKIGWREWRCSKEAPIAYQDFEKGRMVGVFRERPKDWDVGRVFIMFRDGTWQGAHVTYPAPHSAASECIEP